MGFENVDRRLLLRKTKLHSGFTLVELLVVISIIALLLAVLMPSLNRARQQAQSMVCKANLRTIGQVELLYATANDGYLVATRGDRPGNSGFYWAAQLWALFHSTEIPLSSDRGAKPIKKPDWLCCSAEKNFSDNGRHNLSTWGDVFLGYNFWLANICYTRNSTGQAWIQGNNNPPHAKIIKMKRPSDAVANADGHYIHFPGHRIYTDKYDANGDIQEPYGSGLGFLCVKYRHKGGNGLNILLWDGHVGSVVDSIADNYRLNPFGER